jgi:type III secretion protein T
MSPHDLNVFFELAYPFIMAFALAVARALGVVLITPAFNRLGLTGMLRAAVAVVIAVPVAPAVFMAMSIVDTPSSFTLIGMLIKEMLIGLLIGLMFGIPFWAAEVAGELIDLQRGSTMAQLLDPLGVGETSITSTLLSITLTALFFMSGGFSLMIDGFYRSYQLWPAFGFMPIVNQDTAFEVLHLLDRVMDSGVMMIAPIIIALLVADLLLAYLARMAPQLHLFDLSLPVKNVLFALLMVIYVAFLVPNMLEQLGELGEQFHILETAVKGPLQWSSGGERP